MRTYFIAFTLLLSSIPLSADPLEWPVLEGGNGHFYELLDGVTWRQADEASGSMWFNSHQGHLVTLANEEEENWIKEIFPAREFLFIGLYQPEGSLEPEGGWRWVTEEPVTYINWQGEEPNNGVAGEDYAGINPAPFGLGGWVDIWDSYTSAAIVEYDIGGPIQSDTSNWGQVKNLYR